MNNNNHNSNKLQPQPFLKNRLLTSSTSSTRSLSQLQKQKQLNNFFKQTPTPTTTHIKGRMCEYLKTLEKIQKENKLRKKRLTSIKNCVMTTSKMMKSSSTCLFKKNKFFNINNNNNNVDDNNEEQVNKKYPKIIQNVLEYKKEKYQLQNSTQRTTTTTITKDNIISQNNSFVYPVVNNLINNSILHNTNFNNNINNNIHNNNILITKQQKFLKLCIQEYNLQEKIKYHLKQLNYNMDIQNKYEQIIVGIIYDEIQRIMIGEGEQEGGQEGERERECEWEDNYKSGNKKNKIKQRLAPKIELFLL